MKLHVIAREALRLEWPKMRPFVERVRLKGREEWIAEDVYAAILEGSSVAYWADEREGLMVLSPRGDTLHWWILAGPSGCAFVPRAVQAVKALAGQTFKRMSMRTHRPGWTRMARRFGWTATTYEVNL